MQSALWSWKESRWIPAAERRDAPLARGTSVLEQDPLLGASHVAAHSLFTGRIITKIVAHM